MPERIHPFAEHPRVEPEGIHPFTGTSMDGAGAHFTRSQNIHGWCRSAFTRSQEHPWMALERIHASRRHPWMVLETHASIA
jgi:hypothetical protein